jgi:hypothetical protein
LKLKTNKIRNSMAWFKRKEKGLTAAGRQNGRSKGLGINSPTENMMCWDELGT